MKMLKIFLFLFSVFGVYWSVKLIHQRYLQEAIMTFKFKTGHLELDSELIAYYSYQVTKTIGVQLGVLIISTIMLTLIINSLIKKK